MFTDDLIRQLLELLETCGNAAFEIYNKDYKIITKADNSPVTEADLKVNEIIMQELSKLTPHIPIVSEEAELPSAKDLNSWDAFWLIDPIDGTKDFTQKSNEWTINIGLVENNKISAGFLAVPAYKELFYGILNADDPKDNGAWKITNGKKTKLVRVNKSPAQWIDSQESPLILASVNHHEPALDDYINCFNNAKVINIGSNLKICRLAENKGDLYSRTFNLKEWDLAAAHAILKGAGGNIYDWNTTSEITYGRPDFKTNPFESW